MYEIWLAVNIVWEIAVDQASWTIPLAIVFVVLVLLALVRGGDWRGGWRWAWTSAVIAAAAAIVALPALTGAAWSDVSYIVDGLILVAIAAAFGVAVGAFVWLLAVVLRPRAASRPFASVRAAG